MMGTFLWWHMSVWSNVIVISKYFQSMVKIRKNALHNSQHTKIIDCALFRIGRASSGWKFFDSGRW